MERFHGPTRIGLSHSRYLASLSSEQLKDFDYIEVPFELLCFDSQVLPAIAHKPLILHCASLSLGGYTLPVPAVRKRIAELATQTATPWIGEHLSYILADRIDDQYYEPYSDEPYNIGYTVNPVMNRASVENVVANLQLHGSYFDAPIIIENSPLYFRLPGSDLSQTEFINSICAATDTGLLLDLTHLYISSQNFSFDPKKELLKLPLDRVVEVHVSGVSQSGDTHWDNHAGHAPEIIFELLEIVLKNARPQAITFEYNWTPKISWELMRKEFGRVREMLERYTPA